MEPVSTLGKVLVGVGALLLILWFRPGIKAAFAQSRQAKDKDWRGVLIPLLLVALFVVVLIKLT
ncbi:MAG: hypothetical protein B7Z66_04570 [Chromatiales bacterium 21-64-14]|nr:MAG: hypothetical protein B7Z66_04570 [Chromatiales bacterium 21-64-14]HQU14603.1 hypothetical protein [Gammaproteobacteria bacterium]